ncbi:MAG: glycoside hydrolase family 172 protein [Candidatus Latescibacterota bacterium]|jgi:hypothetical protein
MFGDIARITKARTGRCSSWDTTGRNADAWRLEPGESRVLADLKGPGKITHLWMTQGQHYRECLVRITWDNASAPSVLVPLGDFFGLGHGIVNSYQSALFSASTRSNNRFGGGCALNCYVPMPFRERALVELVNESEEPHGQYFYVDYETYDHDLDDDLGYFHAEFRRANPFQGWEEQLSRQGRQPKTGNVINKERQAWDGNYVILETKGRGHYLGCNLSITNFHKGWWGEGDDMIWVDGYKWPPDLHGTGSEDYFNQAWGMQDNAFLRNGSSIFEGGTTLSYSPDPWSEGAYQTSYVFHLENPVRFQREIKVTIEHGHANNLNNEASSVAYWFADRPTRTVKPPPVAKRLPVRRDNQGRWLYDRRNQCPGRPVPLTDEMKA